MKRFHPTPVFNREVPNYTVMVWLLLIVCAVTSCGGSGLIKAFRAGFAASKPAIQSLVPGTISQAKADVVVRDVDDGITAAERGEQCIKSIVETGPQKRIGQARCYLALASDLRAILARHNIGGSSRLDQIASLIEAAIAAFEEFNRAVTFGSMASPPSEDAGKAAEKVLEEKLKDVERRLKALDK